MAKLKIISRQIEKYASISLKIICKTRLKKLRIPCSIEDNPPLLCTDVDEADEYKFIKKFVPNFPIMFDANHFDHETFKSLFRYGMLRLRKSELFFFPRKRSVLT